MLSGCAAGRDRKRKRSIRGKGEVRGKTSKRKGLRRQRVGAGWVRGTAVVTSLIYRRSPIGR